MAIAMALTAPVAAQPLPDSEPASGTQPPADDTQPAPAGDADAPPATDAPPALAPPPSVDGTAPPAAGATPVDGVPPPAAASEPPPVAEPAAPLPPPRPPAVPGLLASNAADQRMFAHSRALDRETLLPDRQLTASLFADYWFAHGPRVAGSFGIYRSFEFYLGVLVDSDTTPATMSTPEMSTSATRIMYGGNLAMFSYAGIQVQGGIAMFAGSGDAPAIQPTANLSFPLDAHWLPFHIENTRVRIGYPIGIGIEWGKL